MKSKFIYGLIVYIIISLMFGVLGAGCEDVIHNNVTPIMFIKITLACGFVMSTTLALMMGAALLLIHCLNKIIE